MFVFDAPDCVAADRAAGRLGALGILADGLDSAAGCAEAVASTADLARVLPEPVQVPGVRRRADAVRLRDVTATAGAENPHRDVGVARTALVSGRQSTRGLVVVRVLADRLRPPPPPWAWSALWPVRFRFAAVADESTLFDWSTEPSSPSLRTRTEMFVFFAPTGWHPMLRRRPAGCPPTVRLPACPNHRPSSGRRSGPLRSRSQRSRWTQRCSTARPNHRSRAQDPDWDVRVARATLRGVRQCRCGLAVVRFLPYSLRSARASARAVLGLAGRLAGEVRVPCRGVRAGGVRLRTLPPLPGLRTRTEMFWFAG